MKTGSARLPAWVLGEFLGTFLLVFFGCGSVAAAVLTGAQVGIFQVAIVWGVGIAVAIHVTSALSGAHLNPAVTCGLALAGEFAPRRIAGYVLVQFIGAFAGAAVLHVLFAGPLRAFEATHGITRGAAGSEASAMIYGEYFPNPGGRPFTEDIRATVAPGTAFLVEAVGTAILMGVILALTDRRNASRPHELVAATIGLTVTILISLLAPLTQGGFNPARDLAPRIFSALAGWGSVPFTANGSLGWLVVYVVAPIAGALVAAIGYRLLLRPAYSAAASSLPANDHVHPL